LRYINPHDPDDAEYDCPDCGQLTGPKLICKCKRERMLRNKDKWRVALDKTIKHFEEKHE